MKIVISGGTGFLGKHLSAYLRVLGHDPKMILRSDWTEGADRISKIINSSDVLINLAGSPVIKRWTAANRENILASRVGTTSLLVECISRLPEKERPKLLLSASAIGIYDTLKVHTEQSSDYDDNFLAEVCQKWENCLVPLSGMQIRVCVIRIGLVLGEDGGMLKQLLPLFKAGLGGKIGSGLQAFSFIHYHDFCRVVEFLMNHNHCEGIFNLTVPEFSTNAMFTKSLAKALHRPAFFIVPQIVLKLIYGKAAVALLKGQSVYPQHLLDCGFKFKYPDVASAIQAVLAKSP
jgi:uncharacterized protein (TIGR01777 family)